MINKLYYVEDGEELLDYLNQRGKYSNPDEALNPLLISARSQHAQEGRGPRRGTRGTQTRRPIRHIPVIVLTTSKAEEDIYRSYDRGANSYITKPVTFDGLVAVMRTLGDYWLELVELPPNRFYF